MSEQDRPDLSARRRPRPVDNLADPADPAAAPTTPINGTLVLVEAWSWVWSGVGVCFCLCSHVVV